MIRKCRTAPVGQISAMRRRVCGCAVLCGVLVVLSSPGGCRRRETATPVRPVPRVSVVQAITADVPLYQDEIGRTVASEVVSIVPQVGGKVIAAHVEDGALVTKGDLLFEIDPRPFQASLASAKATRAQSKADLVLAEIEFERVRNLIAGGAVSQLEYDQADNTVAVDQAKLDGAEAAVQTAELNLEYTKIYSPISGRAGVRMVDAGNIVKDNGPPMLVIQQLDPIQAEFTVTENDLNAVRRRLVDAGVNLASRTGEGLPVEVSIPASVRQGPPAPVHHPTTVPASLSLPATTPATQRSGPRRGVLSFMDNTVQSASGTIRFRATLANSDQYFWPGQFVNIRVILATRKDAVLIPAQAQQVGQQGAFVYVVKPDSTAEIRPISPGQRQGEMMVVDKGVAPGERVIVSGQLLVVPGGKIEVIR